MDIKGPSPMCMPSMSGPPMLPQQHVQAAAPPTPPASSSLSSTPSSTPTPTPTLTASPDKPPFPAAPALLDYRLCIRTRGPGACPPGQGQQQQQQQTRGWHEQRVVLRTPPTRAHIRAAVLRFVELNPHLFGHLLLLGDADANNNHNNNNNSGNGTGTGNGSGRQQQQPPSPPPAAARQQQIRVALTRVVFGDGESYDLSAYAGDDLGRLCAGMCAAPGQQGGTMMMMMMPLFEVTVSNAGPLESFFTL